MGRLMRRLWRVERKAVFREARRIKVQRRPAAMRKRGRESRGMVWTLYVGWGEFGGHVAFGEGIVVNYRECELYVTRCDAKARRYVVSYIKVILKACNARERHHTR
jgi:hypothetical protein